MFKTSLPATTLLLSTVLLLSLGVPAAATEGAALSGQVVAAGEPVASLSTLIQLARGLGRQPPAMRRRLAREGLKVGLAISLNATTDEVRSRTVPVTKKHGIEDLLGAAAEWTEAIVPIQGEWQIHEDEIAGDSRDGAATRCVSDSWHYARPRHAVDAPGRHLHARLDGRLGEHTRLRHLLFVCQSARRHREDSHRITRTHRSVRDLYRRISG